MRGQVTLSVLSFMDAPKEDRYQEVEDLSVFGCRCYLRAHKYRIECSCGYGGTEHPEWLDRYQRFTVRCGKWIYAFYKRMTGIGVARIFGISKHTVYRLYKSDIGKEWAQQDEISPERVSIDELSRKKGHRYATIISAPDEKRVLEVEKRRKTADVTPFFKTKGRTWRKNVVTVTMDAWLSYRGAVQKHCTNAAICFDHFHLAQHFSKAIDRLRVQEAKKAGKQDQEYEMAAFEKV